MLEETPNIPKAAVEVSEKLQKWIAQSGDADSRDFLTPRQLSNLVTRERERADRRDIEFCIAIFGFEYPHGRVDLQELKPKLKARLRLSDDFGFLDEKTLAVVLPDTPHLGGKKVALDCVELFDSRLKLSVVHVFCYPDDAIDNEFAIDFESGVAETDQQQDAHLPRNGVDTKSFSRISFAKKIAPWKRGMDIIFASCGLLALLPVMIVAAVLIKLTSRGPIVFSQLREGIDGKPIRIYKFRTMIQNAESLRKNLAPLSEQDGPAFKIKDDPRLTAVGKYLRKTCIDELPQLFNVLKGDMTLVGPRPLPIEESQACSRWQRKRLDVVPGLTCIWQANGDRLIPFDQWMRMDLEYIRKRSFGIDAELISKTIRMVILHRGSV